jgi:hypothetical protein
MAVSLDEIVSAEGYLTAKDIMPELFFEELCALDREGKQPFGFPGFLAGKHGLTLREARKVVLLWTAFVESDTYVTDALDGSRKI